MLDAHGERSIFLALVSKADLRLANERLAVLLAVNPRDEERRAVLKKEKATIMKALEQLEALK